MPKIAVITPYYKEPLEVLAQCHQSVLAQQPQADHFMVADGFPRAEVAAWNVRHVVLPTSHDDGGNTPRGIGSLLADSEGYDFVAYLDADNWYQPEHLASLLELHQRTGAAVCTCFRSFHLPDGSRLPIAEDAEDTLQHVDSSCFLLHRRAFEILPVWIRMNKRLAPLCDRVFLAAVRHARLDLMSTRQRTVAYRTLWELHYVQAGLELPAGVKSGHGVRSAIQWLQTQEGVNDSLQRLGFWPLTYIRG
jgi:glycosyltransferase involved in cell wall biosynthesis